LLVPGLLQTEEYAREVLGELEGPYRQTVDALVDLRMERQEILTRDNPPGLHCVLDEAVIHRVVGGTKVMHRQLRHLKEMADRPNITLRIVPFRSGMYPRLRVTYVLFEFPDPQDENILYIENEEGEMIVRETLPEEGGQVTPIAYLESFFQLEQLARKDDTQKMIDTALADLPTEELDEEDLSSAPA
jgi:Domain of unknown function (DUF5753)